MAIFKTLNSFFLVKGINGNRDSNLELAVLDILTEPVAHQLVAVQELLVRLGGQRSLSK